MVCYIFSRKKTFCDHVKIICFQGRLVDFKKKNHRMSFVMLTGPQEMSCWDTMLQVATKFMLFVCVGGGWGGGGSLGKPWLKCDEQLGRLLRLDILEDQTCFKPDTGPANKPKLENTILFKFGYYILLIDIDELLARICIAFNYVAVIRTQFSIYFPL